jgi:hypothetical protein
MASPMLAVCIEDYEEDILEEIPQAPATLLLGARREELEAEIEQAKTLVNDHPDADEEIGSYSSETFQRAVDFLKTHIEWVWRKRGTNAPLPTIGPGPNGSIDLYWKEQGWKLLVNIPADSNALATFYGDNYGTQTTRGSLDQKELSLAIVAWMM